MDVFSCGMLSSLYMRTGSCVITSDYKREATAQKSVIVSSLTLEREPPRIPDGTPLSSHL